MKNIELVIAETATAIRVSAAREFALSHGVSVAPSLEAAASQLVLYFTGGGVSLLAREHKKEHKKRQEIRVDFVAGALAHRRKFGGGKGQAIAKAVGLSAKFSPSILDATAGLGRDAFVLASLGARLTLIERSAVVNVLLRDGLDRAREEVDDTALQAIVERMTLIHVDSQDFLSASAEKYDVVYLDPMFPVRKKSADVKKDMKIFHDLIGQDEDADALLERALARASYRVVVKRPRHAPALDNHKPTYSLEGKSSRFDIYALKAVPK